MAKRKVKTKPADAGKSGRRRTAIEPPGWCQRPVTRAIVRAGTCEIEDIAGKRAVEIVDQLCQRIIELEAMADHYAWGPHADGQNAPLTGDAYAKAMAKDGGEIARAYLKERVSSEYHGARNRTAPGGWGINERKYAGQRSGQKRR
jgi:hypothetical protein